MRRAGSFWRSRDRHPNGPGQAPSGGTNTRRRNSSAQHRLGHQLRTVMRAPCASGSRRWIADVLFLVERQPAVLVCHQNTREVSSVRRMVACSRGPAMLVVDHARYSTAHSAKPATPWVARAILDCVELARIRGVGWRLRRQRHAVEQAVEVRDVPGWWRRRTAR